MRKKTAYILLPGLCFALYISCRKPTDKPNTNNTNTNTFADSLRKSCTKPFVGAGDSSNFYLATAFTPNGDGLNDLYKIIGRTSDIATFLMTIYDTTGKLVFQTNNVTRAWDGTDTATGRQSTKYKFYVEVAYTTTGNKSASAGTFLFLLSANSSLGCINIIKADSSSYEFGDQFNISTGFTPSFTSGESYCN